MQQIEESVWALDVFEDVTNVGAEREKRVDGCYQFAFIGEGTLAGFDVLRVVCRPWTNPRNIVMAMGFAVKHAQKMHQVAAPPGL
jgi:hypothetical protein